MEEIENFVKRYKDSFSSLSEKQREIFNEIIEKKKEIQKIENELSQLEEIKKDNDSEFISLAQSEIKSLLKEKERITKEAKTLIEDFSKESKNNQFRTDSVIVEIRAGTGGEEAALFARDLFRMYTKFAESQGWKVRVLNERKSDLGGFKEIIFELSGKDAFKKMKFEGGVHRVQRIPITEKSGRIHTSTASVAVLVKPKKTQIKIKPEELKIEFYRASGPGGQYVNKRETAVRITHIPTGIVVTSQTERSQLENKENALSILEAKLMQQREKELENTLSEERRKQIKKAERSDKIRTYNFPQDRVTDHRIKKTWHNIDKIMEGKIEKIISDLEKHLS